MQELNHQQRRHRQQQQQQRGQLLPQQPAAEAMALSAFPRASFCQIVPPADDAVATPADDELYLAGRHKSPSPAADVADDDEGSPTRSVRRPPRRPSRRQHFSEEAAIAVGEALVAKNGEGDDIRNSPRRRESWKACDWEEMPCFPSSATSSFDGHASQTSLYLVLDDVLLDADAREDEDEDEEGHCGNDNGGEAKDEAEQGPSSSSSSSRNNPNRRRSSLEEILFGGPHGDGDKDDDNFDSSGRSGQTLMAYSVDSSTNGGGNQDGNSRQSSYGRSFRRSLHDTLVQDEEDINPAFLVLGASHGTDLTGSSSRSGDDGITPINGRTDSLDLEGLLKELALDRSDR